MKYPINKQIELKENDFRKKNLFNLLEKEVKGSLLDIGCGKGEFIKRFQHALGIDDSQELIDIARKNNKNKSEVMMIKWNAMDINKAPFEVHADTVTCIDLLEHIEDDDNFLNNLYKYNAERFIFVVPNYQFLYGERDKMLGHHRRYIKDRFIDQLHDRGFKPIKAMAWNLLGIPFYMRKQHTGFNNGFRKGFLNKMLDIWFKYIENNICRINSYIGLSLIVICEKMTEDERCSLSLKQMGYLK